MQLAALASVLLCSLATCRSRAAAATPAATITQDVMCRVTAVEGAGATRTVTVDRGSDDGIIAGWRGEAFYVYRDKPKRDFGRAGSALVLSANADTATVQVTLDRADAAYVAGDLVELRARVPKLTQRSVLWELARRGIVLLTNDREVINPYRELMHEDSDAVPGARLTAMQLALKEVVEFVHDTSIDAPRTAGRHTGKRASEVLASADRADIEAFLRFVTSYPGKYLGRDWKFSEVFATWVINDAPTSADELAMLLVAAPTEADRAALFRKHRDVILKDGMLANLYSTSQAWSDEGSYDRALRLADAVVQGARMFSQAVLVGWGQFSRGYVLADQLRYRDAAAAYGQAMATFRAVKPASADSRKGEAFSLHNRAIMLERLGRLSEALEGYRVSLASKRSLPGIGAHSIGNSLQAIADVMATRNEYAAAIKTYDQCIAVRKTLSDTVGLHGTMGSRARTLSRMGKVEEAEAAFRVLIAAQDRERDLAGLSQTREYLADHLWRAGRYPKSLEQYQAALEVREKLGDRDGIVTALNGIGKLQWNLGNYAASDAAHLRALSEAKDIGDLRAQARALKELGDLRRQSGDAPAALQRYNEALAIRRRLGQRIEQAEIVEQVASIQTDRREYAQAAASYREAAGLYQTAGVRDNYARCLHNTGVCLENAGDLDGAIKQYRLARTIRRQIGARDDEALTSAYMSDVLARQRRMTDAEAELQSAMALIAGSKSLATRGAVLRRVGRLSASMQRFPQALARLSDALKAFRDPSVADRREQATTLIGIAAVVEQQGKFTEALKRYEEALKIATETRDRLTATLALRSIGWVYRSLGDSPRAMASAEQALTLAQEVDDAVLIADARYALAALRHDQGDLKTAYAEMEKAVAAYRAAKNDAGLALAENATGVFDFRSGDYASARKRFERSLVLARSIGSVADVSFALQNLGEVLSKQGKHEEAVKRLTEAEAACARTGAVENLAGIRARTARIRRAWGEALLRAGRKPEALRAMAPCAQLLSMAIASHRASRTEASAAFALTELGSLRLAQKALPAAASALGEAAALAEKTRAKHVLWETYWALARLEEARGNLAAALAAMRKAVAVVEDLRQGLAGGEKGMAGFIASKVKLYEAMADLLGKVGAAEKDPEKRRRTAEEALQFIALARFQIMSRNAVGAAPTGDAALDTASEAYRAGLARQGRLEQERAEALGSGNAAKAREIEAVLARNDEELAGTYVRVAQSDPDFAARLKFDPRRVIEMAASLPAESVLLLCFPGRDVLHLWVFDRSGVRVWKRVAVTRDSVYALVRRFRAGIDQMKERVVRRDPLGEGFGAAAESAPANPAWYRENIRELRLTLGALHDVLLKPVREQLASAETILVLPYGQTCYLPFEALYDPERSAFLGSEKRVAYVTSETHLQAVARSLETELSRPDDCWVAFADPRGRLGSATEEAREIAAMFPLSEVHSAATGTATKTAVYSLRPDCTILHFATHGRLNSADPNQTYLELGVPPDGPGPVDVEIDGSKITVASDGALTQLEVYPRLRKLVRSFRERRMQLVTLSACETARAQETPEAEVLGMPDAFALAGAGAILASQWSVDTYSTIDLMVEFYRLYGKERQSKADSLFLARRTLLTQDGGRYAHPFYWAPFVLYGDWR